ncbi:DUF1365 domain-containing protein [Psychrobacter sp. NG254]|uniref:DUF1365 domain-containing protein n=1 Tax=Psychrobacter sp. NG254 TaxID=2782003 RepID=UPI001888CD83|nr:DUF1365 domain-containing protein [Psychrobacter sp. NG254]MBF2719488.1 DUF1365 domain-containing protein [Psychrobacter sp. NG254]
MPNKTAAQSSSPMPNHELADEAVLSHQLFEGTTWHSRLLPSVNKFVYPYRYWGVNISALAAGQALPEITTTALGESSVIKKWSLKNILPKTLLVKGLPLFSVKKKALQRFCPDDYLQGIRLDKSNSLSDDGGIKIDVTQSDLPSVQALNHRLKQAFNQHAGSVPTGDMLGLLVCRNIGVYFSPVNFYLGFDEQQTPTHLLAEVSNTPWDKRHYYGFLLDGAETEFCHDKDFHVSPFNPIDQLYRWQVKVSQQSDNCLKVRIAINISDERGEVLKTGIKISGVPMTDTTVRKSLRQNPLMNMTSVTRIYWHAFKLYAIKKVPYINYDEKLADSQQKNTDA